MAQPPATPTPRDEPEAARRLITPTELAARWSVSTALLYRWVREGLLAPPEVIRLGRLVRFSLAALEKREASGGLLLPGGWRREER